MPSWRPLGRGLGCQAVGVRTRARSVVPLVLSVLLAPLVLVGCGSRTAVGTAAASSGSAAPSSSAEGTTAAADSSADASPFPANTDPDTAPASAEAAVTVRDIRLARQGAFDRVVLEVGGTGTPGWDVRYVDSASSQGSGEPVDVAGNAVLQVSLTGVGYPYDTGVTEYPPRHPLSAAGTQDVTEVVYDATFEGTAVTFVGTNQRAPFRVYLMKNPTRVVLEVADAS